MSSCDRAVESTEPVATSISMHTIGSRTVHILMAIDRFLNSIMTIGIDRFLKDSIMTIGIDWFHNRVMTIGIDRFLNDRIVTIGRGIDRFLSSIKTIGIDWSINDGIMTVGISNMGINHARVVIGVFVVIRSRGIHW